MPDVRPGIRIAHSVDRACEMPDVRERQDREAAERSRGSFGQFREPAGMPAFRRADVPLGAVPHWHVRVGLTPKLGPSLAQLVLQALHDR